MSLLHCKRRSVARRHPSRPPIGAADARKFAALHAARLAQARSCCLAPCVVEISTAQDAAHTYT